MKELLAQWQDVLEMGNLVNAEIIKLSAADYLNTPGKLMDLLTIYLTARRKEKD